MEVYVVELSVNRDNSSIWAVFSEEEEAKEKVEQKAEMLAWEHETDYDVDRDGRTYTIDVGDDWTQYIDIYAHTLR